MDFYLEMVNRIKELHSLGCYAQVDAACNVLRDFLEVAASKGEMDERQAVAILRKINET